MLPGVHGGIEHTYIHHGGGVVVLYYVRLSVRTLLYFVHAVLFCPNLLCFCLLFCFSLALASFFRFCFCHFFFFPLMYCRVDYLVPYNIRTHFFVKYAHTDTRVHSHFSNILNNKKIFLIFKKTHKVQLYPCNTCIYLSQPFLFSIIFLFSSTASPFSPSFFSLFVWVDFVRLRHFF